MKRRILGEKRKKIKIKQRREKKKNSGSVEKERKLCPPLLSKFENESNLIFPLIFTHPSYHFHFMNMLFYEYVKALIDLDTT